jgi:hypothetical protein
VSGGGVDACRHGGGCMNKIFRAFYSTLEKRKIFQELKEQSNLLKTFTLSNNISSDHQINKQMMKSFHSGYFKIELHN